MNEVTHSIKWKNHKEDIINEQQYLFNNNIACDCVLVSAQGKTMQAHQIVLSSSSEFFHKILAEVPAGIEPTIHIPDGDTDLVEAILKFIYTGETNVASDQLSSLLDLCNVLDIKGIVTNGCSLNRMNMSYIKDKKKFTEQRTRPKFITPTTSNEAASGDSEELFLVMQAESASSEPEEMDNEADQEFDIEYLDEDCLAGVKDEPINDSNNIMIFNEETSGEFVSFEIEKSHDDGGSSLDESNGNLSPGSPTKRKRIVYRDPTTRSQIDEALNEVNKGKTIHQLSVEYNLPRSTLYHRFRNNESLKRNYRSERRSALDNAVQSVLQEHCSLKKASDKFNVPKTAIWREVRKYETYQPPSKEITEERYNAQQEILSGKSLTSISSKYGIPMTTLHRDKKKLSVEGKLPESFRVKDRTENSEYNQRLELALQKCRQGMTQYKASRLFNIPKATMWRHANALLKAEQQTNKKQNRSPDKKQS